MAQEAAAYHISSTAGAAVEGLIQDSEDGSQPETCKGCRYLVPRHEGRAVDFLASSSFNRADMETANVASINLVHRTLTELLPSEIAKSYLRFGKVFDRFGAELPDWQTCIPLAFTDLRGTQHIIHRYCIHCGRSCYFSRGSSFVMGKGFSAPIMGTSSGFLLRRELALPILAMKWRKVTIRPVNIVSKALDGLADMLPWRIPVA